RRDTTPCPPPWPADGQIFDLNLATASGAKTAVMPSAHSSACTTGPPAATPSSSPRVASAMIVTGFTLTHACSQPSIVSVGTKALLVKVSGNVTVNPKI